MTAPLDQETVSNSPPASPAVPGGRYLFWWGMLVFIVGGLLGAGIVSISQTPSASPAAQRNAQPLPVFGRVSDFQLTERASQTVTREDLLGRVWVADFFFTSCAGICPIMSNAMSRLQERVRDNTEVTLVSISVDPERDTPERLRRYAAKFQADPVRWWFLTGDKRVIYKLSQESFRLSVEEIPEEEREPDMEEVLHSSKLVLLDRQCRIRGYYDGETPETADILAEDIRNLLKE